MNHFYLIYYTKKKVESRINSAVAKNARYFHNLIILFFFRIFLSSLESQEVGADL
jgi:hypothetical protein